MRIIGAAFIALAVYITAQSLYVLGTAAHPRHSPVGIAWLALTAVAMFALAPAKCARARRWATGPADRGPVTVPVDSTLVIDRFSPVLSGRELPRGCL